MKLFTNALIINEYESFKGYVAIEGSFIASVGRGEPDEKTVAEAESVIDFEGDMLLPGVIDTHVHFRDGGTGNLKGDIETESLAAVAGGVTSFFDMPNTAPPTVDLDALKIKMERANEKSYANYAFFLGATNSNLETLVNADYTHIPGVKLFMGASTGNMLVDNESTIRRMFEMLKCPIAVHAESQTAINDATRDIKARMGDDIPVSLHNELRPRRACIEAATEAVNLAKLTGARLNVLHISTAEELELFNPGPADGKKITAETCPHYLIFGGKGDYERLGSRVKCNPAIKETTDRDALRRAIVDGRIDIIATDHAPHLPADKEGTAITAASGMPGVQFSLPLMLTLTESIDGLKPERVVELMAHNPARIYGIDRRGFIRKGFYADIVRVAHRHSVISDSDVVSRCGWTPYAGMEIEYKVVATYVNGADATESRNPSPLRFNAR